MITGIETLTDELNNIEKLLIEYNSLTNMLLSVNLENTDEVDLIFSKRDELIKEIDELRAELTESIDAQSKEDALFIRKMLSGQTSISGASLSGAEKNLHSKIIDIRSIQIDILKKEEEIGLKYKLKREEIRSTLADLQQDKKKINFYNNASSNSKGQDFDNQS